MDVQFDRERVVGPLVKHIDRRARVDEERNCREVLHCSRTAVVPRWCVLQRRDLVVAHILVALKCNELCSVDEIHFIHFISFIVYTRELKSIAYTNL